MRFPVFAAISLLVALPAVIPAQSPSPVKGDFPTRHQVTLAWDPSPDPSVAGYVVYVGVSGPLRPQAFDAGTNTVYTVTDLEAGVTYTFFVTAYDAARNESDPSNSLDYTPAASNNGSAPAAPSGLQVAVTGTTQVALTWTDNATSEDGFRIERSLNGTNFTVIATVGPDVTQFVVTDASGFRANLYPYWFRVAAFTGDTLSPYSNPACAITNQADLVVLAVVPVPALPTAGSPVQFQATIRNLGSAATPQGINARVAFALDGGTAIAWADNTNSLAPGQTLTLTANAGIGPTAAWTATAGSHTLVATVDDQGLLRESNPRNNSRSTPLLVPFAGAPHISILVSPASISERDPAGANFTITRAGNLDSDLVIQIAIGGTARNGIDYSPLAGLAWIPAYAATTTIPVAPIDNVALSPPKTLELSLVPNLAYQFEAQSRATLTILDSDIDSDGDGMSDRAELVAGTDPLDPKSNLRILSIVPEPNGAVVVTWASVPGIGYHLEASQTLADWDWLAVSPTFGATNSVTSWTDLGAGGNRFYRVVVDAGYWPGP